MAHCIRSFITDGLLPGIWSVLAFLPMITILFFILSVLEDSRLLLHTCKSAGRLLSRYGLSPNGLYSLAMGFGCSAPALLAAGNLPSKKERFLVALTIPFISCSAKLPVYLLLSSFILPDFYIVTIVLIYLSGIIIGLTVCKSANSILPIKSNFPEDISPMPLRLPSLKKALYSALSGALSFIKKIFTVILAASAIVWLLENISTNFVFTENIEDSLLANISRHLTHIFSPIGFDDWRVVAALFSGLTSKEAIVSTLSVIAASSEYSSTSLMLSEIFTPLSAFSFMIFCLLYTPCITTCILIKRTIKKLSYTIYLLIFQFITAWFVSFLIFNLLKVIIQVKEVFL